MGTVTGSSNRPGSVFYVQTMVLVSALVLAALMAAELAKDPDQVSGYEAYSIATSLAGGHGYSFRCDDRWLFDDIDRVSRLDAPEYCPTAWVDPVYPFLLAALIRATGDWHLIAGAILNLVLFVAIVMLTFRVASNYAGIWAGAFAAMLLSASLYFRDGDWAPLLNNTLLATAFVLLFALALHRAVRTSARRNDAILGLAIGFAILACPGATGFLPVAVLFVAFARPQPWSSAVSKSAVVLFVSILVLMPWATRNYLVFDELVPVRTGSGQIAFVGTVAAGGTVEPATLRFSLDPPWRASSAEQAVATARETKGRRALTAFQLRYAREVAGNSWNGMNEAQRDKWFQSEVRTYLLENPLLSMKLAFWKLHAFSQCMGRFGTFFVALAAVGGILAVASWQLELLTLSMSIAAFTAPFALIIPYWARYRIPIEPIIVIAATVTLWQLVRFSRELVLFRPKDHA
jgi:Dolichyl-phosphate-mannose-protein mannosyltransferase